MSARPEDGCRTDLRPGAVLRDTYTVVKRLGQGAFADVYLVRHRYMGLQAMKVLFDLSDLEHQEEGFREAFLLSTITHPGIVRVFDANRLDEEHGGRSFVTMEYMSGGTLHQLLDDHPTGLQLRKALDLAVQIADALGHAHLVSTGVVHRDVKPSCGVPNCVTLKVPSYRILCPLSI